MSSRQSVPKIPAIAGVDSPFEKEQDKVSVSTQRSRRRSSIFEEIIVPDPSICRWLLDIISEDELENQVVLNTEEEGCCGKFIYDGTRTLNDITIKNVNIPTLDIDKVNLLRDSYKLCLQKVRKITCMLDLGDISSKLMSAANIHSLDVLIKHDEILFGSIRYNSIGLVEQVENINNQINMINNAPAPDVYTRPEANEIFDAKADKSDTYTKTETDTMLDEIQIKTQLVDSYTKSEDDALLLQKANVIDIVDSYSKTEDDELLLLKANDADIVYSYSKTEDDALLLLKVNVAEITETDTLLDAKADKTDMIDSYSKTEDDALLLLKVNVTDLTNNVDFTSVQTITGKKQFGVINASSISKLSKNDASILLAGGGNKLVSTLVTQPQLQEIRYIATRKSKAYVFPTLDELNDWMAIQENVAKLVIGDNVYIVDKAVTDNWQDGTDLKRTATGGGNAITDISIDGNVLTPAINKIFVDIDYDQSISGQKTFNTTIHSVGIMDQTYDNTNVVCELRGDRSIADIQSASYSKSEDDALLLLKADKSTTYSKTEDDVLLLLKADKTQLIGSQTKREKNNFLNNKADNGVSYTKGEDDALLLLNADKTQLIDTYTKGETNNLLNNKANAGVSYKKGEDDALLLLKADKTQLIDSYSKGEDDALLLLKADKIYLIDSYTKGETNNLLKNNADNGDSYTKCEGNAFLLPNVDKSTTYTKTEDDAPLLLKADKTQLIDSYSKGEDEALLLLKADKTQLIDSYTKDETNNLLNNKADTGVSYTKVEDEALLLLKADKTQLIDSYTKDETNNLLNNKADTGVSYTKGEDDVILLPKADKSTTYTKTEDDTLLLLKANKSTTYTKTKDDAPILLKADKTQLIDSYTKDEDNALLLLKADKTQLIDSNTKGQTINLLNNKTNQSTIYSKTETDQLISEIDVKDVDLTDYYNKTKTKELLGEKADATELSNYMTLGTTQAINANNTLNNACRFVSSIDGMSTITGLSFVKSDADDIVVLLGAGSTKPHSEFTGSPTDLSNYYNKSEIYSRIETVNKYVRLDGSIQQTITERLKYVSPFSGTYDETQNPVENTYLNQLEVDAKLTNYVNTVNNQSINGTKTFNSNVNATEFVKTGKDDTLILFTGGGDVLLSSFGRVEDITSTVSSYGSNMEFTNAIFIKIGKMRFFSATVHPYNTISTSTQYRMVSLSFQNHQESDSPLIVVRDTTNSIKTERYQEPIPPAQRVPIGEKTLQKQVKDSGDILFSTNEEFIPSVSNAPTKLDLCSQLERSSFLAIEGSDPQLIVFSDRVILTVSYETSGLFPNGYLFKSYPEEVRPKARDKVIALVGTNITNKNSIFYYIDQNGPFIFSTSQIPSKTAIISNVTHNKKYELSKIINYDANNDGRVDIMDTWHVNSNRTFETQSHVYEAVNKQTYLIATGLFGDNKVNYLNRDIKLMDELAIYKADRAAFFIKEGPFITFSF
ncbi:MAG: hypothetical protein EZS28_022058, partial [Streblomastix strix]